ncbi:hypothetical protein [Rubripirellula amarantea]|nr:hypothetical protein [Rubripirellula amarantea]
MKMSTPLYAVLFAALAILPAIAEEPDGSIPKEPASQISDWALAGVIWSDASLTRKLANRAARESESPQQSAQYEELSRRSAKIVDAMEAFGWKQINRSSNLNGERSEAAPGSNNRISAKPSRQANADTSLNRAGSSRDAATLDSRIKRFDTETPADTDHPGIDDERTRRRTEMDLDNYRVDDFVDETDAESRNRADAIEDGVEKAIAAAAGRRGMGRGAVGRITEREAQTQSATMAYSNGSIYDADDYESDLDYGIGNGQTEPSIDSETANADDRDDDIDRNNPDPTVDGEDEMIAAMNREQSGNRTNTTRDRNIRSRNNLDQYTSERSKHVQDSRWVQFHLDANQSVWQDLTNRDNLVLQTRMALLKLQANMRAASEATDNEQLRESLGQF